MCVCCLVLLRSALHDVLKAVQCIAIGCDLTLDDCGFVDQWDAQATVKRINESLIERGYVTWFDLTNMKGITSALAAASVAFLCSIVADRS